MMMLVVIYRASPQFDTFSILDVLGIPLTLKGRSPTCLSSENGYMGMTSS
jgi:hypothetical protein